MMNISLPSSRVLIPGLSLNNGTSLFSRITQGMEPWDIRDVEKALRKIPVESQETFGRLVLQLYPETWSGFWRKDLIEKFAADIPREDVEFVALFLLQLIEKLSENEKSKIFGLLRRDLKAVITAIEKVPHLLENVDDSTRFQLFQVFCQLPADVETLPKQFGNLFTESMTGGEKNSLLLLL